MTKFEVLKCTIIIKCDYLFQNNTWNIETTAHVFGAFGWTLVDCLDNMYCLSSEISGNIHETSYKVGKS